MKLRRLKQSILVLALILIYLLAGAVLPYMQQPKISQQTKKSFDAKRFYRDDVSGERACVLSDNGEALRERIRLIAQAKERIVLSTFEFHADESGKLVLAALLDAAERGVEVCVLADGFPALLSMEGNAYFYALSSLENVTIKLYNPVKLWKPWTLMGRLHDKYLLVDQDAYILGGRNTYDYFLGDQPGYKNYDWDILVCQANDSMKQLQDYFDSVWNLPVCELFHKDAVYQKRDNVQEAKQKLHEIYQQAQKEHEDWFKPCDYKAFTYPVNQISLLCNPITIEAKEPVVFYEMTELMKQAENEVRFHTPYIICNQWMMEQMTDLCKQVGRVEMMTNSVANNGNPFGAMDYQKHKGEILESGVSILEYDGGVSYHGKCFTIDDRLSGVGSFNWDMRSAYLDTELMLVVDSKELNRDLREKMASYEKQALTVLDETHSQAPDGGKAQEISTKKQFRIDLIGFLGAWARFLM